MTTLRVVAYDIDEGTFQNPMSIATQGVILAIRLARATSTDAFVAIINLGTPSFSPGPNDIPSSRPESHLTCIP